MTPPPLRRFKPYPSYDETTIDWAPAIPTHWTQTKLSRFTLSRCDGPFGSGLKSEHYTSAGVRVIRLQNIGFAAFDDSNEAFIDERYASELGEHDVREGDVLVAGLGDEGHPVGRACVAPGNIVPAIVKADCFRFRLDQRQAIPQFVAYQLSATADATSALATGATRSRMNLSATAARHVVLPTLEEQARIVGLIDREAARIDALIDKKEQFLELLHVSRAAVVTSAVTRGIDREVEMRSSEVEWLTHIPTHWRSTKIRRLFRQAKRQGHPDRTVLSVYREFGVVAKASRDDNHNKTPENLDVYQIVNAGDLVINKMKAWQGSLGVSDLDGITSPDYVVYAPNHQERARFLHYFLRNRLLVGTYLANSNGIRPSQWRLEPERFENLTIFLPPRGEQDSICMFLDQHGQRFSALVKRVEEGVQSLRALRAAFITAAVTGKIDVRGEVA